MAAIDTFTSNTYVSDNAGNINWKTLRSDEWSLELRGYIAKVDTEVPHNTAAIPIIFDVIESSVVNEGDTHKSRQRGTVVVTAATVVDKVLNGAWEELKRFANNYTITKTRQNNNTLTAATLLTAQEILETINPANWFSDVITVSSWATRTERYVDDELGLAVTKTESVVLHSAPQSTNTKGEFHTRRQVDEIRDIKTSIVIDGYSGTFFDRISTETIQFTFPGIFLGYSSSAAFLAPQGRTVFQFDPLVRTPFTALVQAKVRETLLDEADMATLLSVPPSGLGFDTVLAELFVAKPIDIQYGGILFSLNIPNVLSDDEYAASSTLVATTNGSDTYYGSGIADVYTWRASEPTASEYIAMIGDEVCIQDTIKPWKYGLFWRQRVTIELQ